MTIRADSYSSVADVVAFTRHLLDGATSFNTTTRPPLTDVERFIDRASGVLNVSLRLVGLATPISNTTAKLACDDWVAARCAEYVELTQRGAGYNEGEGSRTAGFRNLYASGEKFAKEVRLGFIRLGVTESNRASDGLQFTGLDAVSQRSDPSDGALEQPMFTREQFTDPTKTRFNQTEEAEAE
jgi:hypothetical protein